MPPASSHALLALSAALATIIPKDQLPTESISQLAEMLAPDVGARMQMIKSLSPGADADAQATLDRWSALDEDKQQ